jgi:hypothetical protein
MPRRSRTTASWKPRLVTEIRDRSGCGGESLRRGGRHADAKNTELSLIRDLHVASSPN